MSHARLTFIGVATAILVIVGCAGPAWSVHGEFPATGQRRATAKGEETTTTNFEKTAQSHDPAATATDGELSPAQVLAYMERMKNERPSEYAVMQSAFVDKSRLTPREVQQMLEDRRLGMASWQQQQSARTPAEPPANWAAQPDPVSKVHAPVVQASPSAARVAQSPLPVSTPASVAAVAAPTTAVTRQIGDMPSVRPAPAVQPSAATQATSESAIAVRAVAAEDLGPGQWNHEIEAALTSLSADLVRPNLDRDEKARLEIMRRLLYVATNQRDKAVTPIDQLDEDEQEYWKYQIHGLLVSIDADGKHPTTRRAALALRNLRTATDHLANVSTLDVRNLTFCKEVLSYGEYRVFDSYSFRAKDEVVLYVEVDNFAAHPRGDSFETELHSSYEIVDDAGRRVANVVLPIDKQVSTNRRRDYFIAYLITMPSQIASGSYRLRLTVEDMIGKKSNYATVDFRIQ